MYSSSTIGITTVDSSCILPTTSINPNDQIVLSHTGHSIVSSNIVEYVLRKMDFDIDIDFRFHLNSYYDDADSDYFTPIKQFVHTNKYRVDPVPNTGKDKYKHKANTYRVSKRIGSELRKQSKFKSEGHKIRYNTKRNTGWGYEWYKLSSEKTWKKNKRKKQWMSTKWEQSLKSKDHIVSIRPIKDVMLYTEGYNDNLKDMYFYLYHAIYGERAEMFLQKDIHNLNINKIVIPQ